MKVDLDKQILDLAGKPVQDAGMEKPYTLKDVAVGGLQYDDRQKPKEEMQKLADFKLALRLFDGGVQELSIDELKRVKTVIGVTHSTLFVGRACEILEAK